MKKSDAAIQAQRTLQATERLLAAKVAHDDLIEFAQLMTPDPDEPDNVSASLYKAAPHHRMLAQALQDVESGKCLRLLISMPPQHGKECAHDTPVLTPSGFVLHGDLRNGDFVYGGDGRPTMVVAIGTELPADCEVKFSDGEVIHCHENHEWVVHRNDVLHKTITTLETKQMERAGVRHGCEGRGGRWRFSVDWVTIHGERKILPVEPYSFGAWLGDGTTGGANITHAKSDSAVAAEVALAYPISVVHEHSGTGVMRTSFCGDGSRNNPSSFARALKASGAYLEKHIPDVYFTASVEQRQRLLAGLMDTDGYIHHKTRRACFSTCSRRLADDVATLIRTFGMRATVAEFEPHMSTSGIQGRKSVYQVTFSPTVSIPCVLDRKRTNGFSVAYRTRGIVAIRRVTPKMGRCIQVENTDGIYLVGRGLIPTHNSQLSSRFCPAWLIGRSPWKNLMLGSYNKDFANEFGDDVRNIMDTPAYKLVFPKSGLRIGSRAKDHMVTTRGGKLSFLGRGGTGTGRPADIFFVDDPIKDAKEAESPTIRNDVWQWFTKVAFTRCHAASAIVVIQTRWSEDDLIGRLTDPGNPFYDAEEACKWTYINIPAIFTDPRDEPIAKALGIEMGQPLWPERYTIEHLASAKRLNPTGFSALYMGRPTPPEGSFYKADILIGYNSMAELPRNMMMYGSGDLAVTPDKDSDMTCVGNWGIDSNSDLWLLPDLYWERKAADQVVDQLIDFASAHKWMTFAVEKGPIDRAVGPFLQRRMRERGTYFHVEKFPTIGNKAGRSLSIRGRMAQGRVHFPTFARWWPAAKEQLLKFTGTGADREDDFADMVAMIGQLMDVVMAGSKPVEKTDEKVVCIGTLRWIKQMDEYKRRQDRRHKALAGM